MIQAAYLFGYTLVPSIIAFGVILLREKARLPMTLGFPRLLGLFVAVSVTCIVAFVALLAAAAFAGLSSVAGLTQLWLLLSGVASYYVGTRILIRMLRPATTP